MYYLHNLFLFHIFIFYSIIFFGKRFPTVTIILSRRTLNQSSLFREIMLSKFAVANNTYYVKSKIVYLNEYIFFIYYVFRTSCYTNSYNIIGIVNNKCQCSTQVDGLSCRSLVRANLHSTRRDYYKSMRVNRYRIPSK